MSESGHSQPGLCGIERRRRWKEPGPGGPQNLSGPGGRERDYIAPWERERRVSVCSVCSGHPSGLHPLPDVFVSSCHMPDTDVSAGMNLSEPLSPYVGRGLRGEGAAVKALGWRRLLEKVREWTRTPIYRKHRCQVAEAELVYSEGG